MNEFVQLCAAFWTGFAAGFAFAKFAMPKLVERFAKVKAKAQAAIDAVKAPTDKP